MANIRDVARKAGVAPITVSRVINDSEYVSAEVRSRVEKAIAELNYVPNRLGPSMRSKRSNTIGLIVTDITNPFWTTVVRGVEDAAYKAGYHLFLCNSDESLEKELEYTELLLSRQVDGFLIAPANTSSDSLEVIQKQKKPIVLCIMDGWGINENYENNAVALAKTPNIDFLTKTFPYSTLDASGEDVGLPIGQVGNSEVGHMNLGSGRVVLQTLPKINKAFANNKIEKNTNFQNFLFNHNKNKIVHLLGLCSDGGVHSHSNHILEMSKLLDKNNCKAYIHIFSDGRDCSPKQLGQHIKKFEMSLPKNIKIVSLIGRYYSMDRDNRWERVKKAFDLIVYGKYERKFSNISRGLEEAYKYNETDEFISPTLIGDYKGFEDGDSLIMINFRADRVRELLTALLDPKFKEFEKDTNTPILLNNLGMTEYSTELSNFMNSIFVKEKIKDTLGEVISKANLKQLRLAETEKYPHVTFFFNGGEETVYPGETRIMIPSPKISTYDLKPEMSAKKVETELISSIKSKTYDLIIINFANPDMVGHTGDLKAAIKAVETVDTAVGNVKDMIIKLDGIMLLTADHGNCEIMFDEIMNLPHTSHTCNKVPLILISKNNDYKLRNGRLADIAPTILELISIKSPKGMSGESLLVK